MQYFLGNDFDIGHKNRYYSPNMQILQLIFPFSPLKTLFSSFFYRRNRRLSLSSIPHRHGYAKTYIAKKDGRQSLATVFGLFTLFLKLSLFICSAVKGFIFLAGPTYRTSFLLQSELQTELIPFLYSSFLPFLYVF